MSSSIVVLESTAEGTFEIEPVSPVALNGGVAFDPAILAGATELTTAAELALRVFRLVDQHRLEEMAGLLTPDVDFLNPFGALTGRAAVVANFAPMKVGFPDSRHLISSVDVAGETVTVEGEWTGTNSGPIATPGGEVTTGKTVRFPFAGICRVRDGRLATVHIYHDLVVMYRQLGLM